jgi:cytochrome c553
LNDSSSRKIDSPGHTDIRGEFGVSILPNAPKLAGQPETNLAEQLMAYRSGKRSDEIMSAIAKPLADAGITDLTAWFASIAIEAKPPK